jgi:stearoyl-CoA desaturase (delta-9 desaturase)
MRRAGYFGLVSLLVIAGTVIAAMELNASPFDAFYVLPIAFLATSLGANTAYHMYFTHKTFTTGIIFRGILALLGTILCQDSVAQWVANHLRHHRHVDVVGKDPHTPRQFGDSPLKTLTIGLFWASAGWKFSRVISSKKFYAKQLLDDRISGWFDRHFTAVSLAGFWMPFVLGWLLGGTNLALKWFAYFGALRVFIGYFFTEFVVNGICHILGSRKFNIKGNSTNLTLLAPLSFGATLHHNHHAFPSVLSPAFDGEIDTMKMIYWLLERLRIINIKPGPTQNDIAVKKQTSDIV